MLVSGKYLLIKLQRKQRGNVKLNEAIDELIFDLESNEFSSFDQLKALRSDADKVYGDKVCFFNINVHRTMVMLQFGEDGRARIVWVGSHDAYEGTFKNNKKTIEKWLRANDVI